MNLYLLDAYKKQLHTIIEEVRTIKKKPALVFKENIFYPGGGGQPPDLGFVQLPSGEEIFVQRILKQDGMVFCCLSDKAEVNIDVKVLIKIDWDRRYRFMRYHTAAHVLMGAISRSVDEYSPEGIDIIEDGSSCTVKFFASWNSDKTETARKVFELSNSIISENRGVAARDYDNLIEAQNDFGNIYRGPDYLSGSVRLIIIDNWDANPCGGTHIHSLSEIRRIRLLDFTENKISFCID